MALQTIHLPQQHSRHPFVNNRKPRLQNVSRIPAISGVPDTEIPPYSLLSTPVYSLVSASKDGYVTMNMITYASPIALRPQRKFALGLYVQSLTYQHMKQTGRGVLQILQQSHSSLTQLLGQTSGRDVDKIVEMQKLGFTIAQEYGLPTLADAVGLMELKVVSDYIPAGDHEVVVCDVLNWKTVDLTGSCSTPLYTGYLKNEGFL